MDGTLTDLNAIPQMTDGDVERHAVAVVVDAAGAHRHNLALLGLLLGGVGDDETAGRDLLGLDLLDDDAVLERLDGNRLGLPLSGVAYCRCH